MTYIYLNTYKGGLLYVGIHKWNGDGIDPNYKGSTKLISSSKLESIRILEDVSNLSLKEQLLRESYWINYYCCKYGVYRKVKYAGHVEWYNRYGDGLMLNCHANQGVDKVRTREVQQKRMNTYKNRGESVADRFHKQGLSLKASMSHNYNEVSKKRVLNRPSKRITIVCKVGDIIGCVNKVCTLIGHSNWQVNVQRHLLKEDIYERDGFKFEVISRRELKRTID